MADVANIKRRMTALRLSQRELASLSGRHFDAVGKTLNGKYDSRSSTIEALDAALVAEERRLLAYLLTLHPDLDPGAPSHPEALPVGRIAGGAPFLNGRAA